MNSTRKWLAGLLASALLLAACGRGDKDGEGSSGPQATNASSESSEEPIVIGMATSRTGSVASVGVDCIDGAQFAVDELNDNGGVLGRQIELVVRDDQSTPEVGVEEVRRLVNEGVDALIAPSSSAIALATTSLSEEAKIPMLSCSSSTAPLTIQQFQPYFFSFTPNTLMSGRAEAIALNELGFDHFALLGADYEGGHAAVESFKQNIKEINPNVTLGAEVFPPLGETDYTSYINALMADDAPVIYSILFGADLVAFTRQASAAGLFEEKQFAALYDSAVMSDLGEDAPKGVIAFERAPWQALEGERAEAFVKGFVEKFDRYPSSWSVMVYDAIIAWAQAVEDAGTTDGDAVVKAFENGEFETLRGPVTLRPEDHQAPVGEYYARIGDYDPELGFARFEDIKLVPGESLLPTVDELEEMRASA